MKHPILIIIIPGLLYCGLSIAINSWWPIMAFMAGIGIGLLIDRSLNRKSHK